MTSKNIIKILILIISQKNFYYINNEKQFTMLIKINLRKMKTK